MVVCEMDVIYAKHYVKINSKLKLKNTTYEL